MDFVFVIIAKRYNIAFVSISLAEALVRSDAVILYVMFYKTLHVLLEPLCSEKSKSSLSAAHLSGNGIGIFFCQEVFHHTATLFLTYCTYSCIIYPLSTLENRKNIKYFFSDRCYVRYGRVERSLM